MAVYKRGKVWYVYYYHRVNGVPKKKGVAVGPRKEVAEELDRKFTEMKKAGINPTMGQIDLKEIIQESLPVNKPQGITLKHFKSVYFELHVTTLRPKTQEGYHGSMKRLLAVFGRTRLDEITKVKVRTYMSQRKREGVGDATVNREVACIKGVLTKALEWEYITKHPLSGLKLLPEPPPKDRYLTKEEANGLIRVSSSYLRNIIILALGTGMRKGEIFNLTWDDVKFDELFNFGQITMIGKGGKKRRIRMNKAVHNLFVQLEKSDHSQYVFTSSKTGTKFTDVKRSFKTALKAAGIENFRFHDLRHTAASWMVMEGVSLYAVKEILGHADIKTTQRYAHLSPGYLEREIGKLDSYLIPEEDSINDSPSFEKVAI
jgi:integrase